MVSAGRAPKNHPATARSFPTRPERFELPTFGSVVAYVQGFLALLSADEVLSDALRWGQSCSRGDTTGDVVIWDAVWDSPSVPNGRSSVRRRNRRAKIDHRLLDAVQDLCATVVLSREAVAQSPSRRALWEEDTGICSI